MPPPNPNTVDGASPWERRFRFDEWRQNLYMLAMDIVTFTDARANLKAVMDKVAADKTPVIIHRRDAEDMVMVSKAEWEGLQETLHLLSSPRNAACLMDAIAEARRGDYAALIGPDEDVAAAILKAAQTIAAE